MSDSFVMICGLQIGVLQQDTRGHGDRWKASTGFYSNWAFRRKVERYLLNTSETPKPISFEIYMRPAHPNRCSEKPNYK